MSKHSKSDLDNRSQQLDDQNPSYHRSRGASPEEAEALAQQRREERDGDTPPSKGAPPLASKPE